jgi:hypothetical protein
MPCNQDIRKDRKKEALHGLCQIMSLLAVVASASDIVSVAFTEMKQEAL